MESNPEQRQQRDKTSTTQSLKNPETRLKEILQRAKQQKTQNVRKPTSNQKQQWY